MTGYIYNDNQENTRQGQPEKTTCVDLLPSFTYSIVRCDKSVRETSREVESCPVFSVLGYRWVKSSCFFPSLNYLILLLP